MRLALRNFLFSILAILMAGSVRAQEYPSKLVRLVVPFAAGGGNDTVARVISQQLSVSLRQQVIVENRPGAGGMMGAEAAARAAPDGYTLFLGGVGSLAVNPNLVRKVPYDPVRDFAPVALIASAPSVLVVHPSVPARSIAEFQSYARANPGKLNYASNGNGSSAHLAAVMYESATGIRMVHVPYKGLAPALADLLSGEVQLMFSSVVAIVPQIKVGRLRALAVTGKKRIALLPDLQTLAESGLAGYEAGSWYGVLAPAGTPRAIVNKLNAHIVAALDQPSVRDQLINEGAEPIGGAPEEFAAHISAELVRMRKLISAGRMQME